MKPFKSFLAKELEEYLAYCRGLGYSDQSFRSRLRRNKKGIKRVRVKLIAHLSD